MNLKKYKDIKDAKDILSKTKRVKRDLSFDMWEESELGLSHKIDQFVPLNQKKSFSEFSNNTSEQFNESIPETTYKSSKKQKYLPYIQGLVGKYNISSLTSVLSNNLDIEDEPWNTDNFLPQLINQSKSNNETSKIQKSISNL